mgnify:CR=1 FL=1
MTVGIDAIDFYIPPIALQIGSLAEAREIPAAKLEKGLGLKSIALADIDEEDGPQGQRGVRAVEVAQTSLAWSAGLREGDLIISVNKQPIYSLKDVEQAVDENDAMLLLNVVRGNTGLFIVIR